MSNYEQWAIEQAAGTMTRLKELTETGKITLDSAVAVGEARALLQILSDALASHHEHAL